MEAAALVTTVNALLNADVAREVTREALDILREHFTDPRAAGPQMAARAAGPLRTVAASCAALASDLLRAIDTGK